MFSMILALSLAQPCPCGPSCLCPAGDCPNCLQTVQVVQGCPGGVCARPPASPFIVVTPATIPRAMAARVAVVVSSRPHAVRGLFSRLLHPFHRVRAGCGG